MAMYVVECTNEFETFYYYEEADSVQEAVDSVRNYIPDEEKVYQVSKLVKGWK